MTNRDKIDVLQKAIDERFKAIKQMKEAIEAHQSTIQELAEELEELKREDLYVNLKSNLTAIRNYCKVAKCVNCPFNVGTGKCYLTLHAPLFWELK